MAAEQRFLGELLARHGVIAADKLEPLFAAQRERGGDLFDLVINTGAVDEMAIARVLAEEARLPLVEKIDPAEISTALAIRVPPFPSQKHIACSSSVRTRRRCTSSAAIHSTRRRSTIFA